jgi:YggT family protein
MQDALIFIFRSLLDLYIICFVLRLLLQWVRADFRNPLSQFILRVTDPLVIPVRRLVPAIGSLDTATLLIAVIIQLIATAILVNVACVGDTDIIQLVGIALVRLLQLSLRIYLFVVLIYVILSWVAPGGSYNPAANLLASLVEPVLAPVRRLVPTIGGLDLSALFVLIGIQALSMLLPIGRVMSGIVCTSMGQPL